MGHHIIKQKDDFYAIWSTVLDDFVLVDATPEEIVEYETDRERRMWQSHVEKVVEEIEEKGRFRGYKTLDEAQALRKIVHGEEYQWN